MDHGYLFNQGEALQAYHYLGAFPVEEEGVQGWRFRVWAPKAKAVSLVGPFNDWQAGKAPLSPQGHTGIWSGFYPALPEWTLYKYAVLGADGQEVLKADPFARHHEERPGTCSKLYIDKPFAWSDHAFMAARKDATAPQPLNIYELHLASWRRHEDGAVYSYRDLAPVLASYITDMGYNAVELMPITEYPLDDSWGYQVSGYFAPTARFGTPDDFRYLVNTLHEHGIKVILDWVPAHFPKDAFGLYRFDGSPCYEYADSRLAEHKEWGTMVFDYGKAEVISFLLSSAWYWLDEYHIDGLRVDAVSSMLYLDYGRQEQIRNIHGGNENLEAIHFLRRLNQMARTHFPGAYIVAEESTAFPKVTAPIDAGGLGFTHKWNMGFMHDSLKYMSVDYYARKYHHQQMTFSMTYAFSERYILPFSHDEVVHGKRSIIGRMPGDIWRQFASLRTLLVWQLCHPGAKLNFMGSEFGQFIEWRFKEPLEWFLLDYPLHKQVHDFTRAFNHFYLERPELWAQDQSWEGFRWIQADDPQNSVFAFERMAEGKRLLVILNLTPATLPSYRFKLQDYGRYRLLFNSDDKAWGGSGYWDERKARPCLSSDPPSRASAEASHAAQRSELKGQAQAAMEKRADFLRFREDVKQAYLALFEAAGERPPKDYLGQSPFEGLEGPVAEPPKADLATPAPSLTLSLPPLSALVFEALDPA